MIAFLLILVIVLAGGGWLLWQILEIAAWLVAVLVIAAAAIAAWAYGALRPRA